MDEIALHVYECGKGLFEEHGDGDSTPPSSFHNPRSGRKLLQMYLFFSREYKKSKEFDKNKEDTWLARDIRHAGKLGGVQDIPI